jgi:regulatory protein
MRRRGVTDEIAAVVLDRLAAVGLIDDEAFAAAFVSSARARRGLGRQALATELRKRGVDPDTVEAAMALVGADDEEESARELVLRRLRSMDRLPEQVRTRRLLAMLTRKGYPVELAVRVVSEQVAQGPDGGGRMGWVVDGDEDDGSV